MEGFSIFLNTAKYYSNTYSPLLDTYFFKKLFSYLDIYYYITFFIIRPPL